LSIVELRRYVNFDLGARDAGVGGADGLVGGEDPHTADAAGLLVALAEGHVVGLLHHELRFRQPHAGEAGGQVSGAAGAAAAAGDGGRRRRCSHGHYHQQQQERARGRRIRSSHVCTYGDDSWRCLYAAGTHLFKRSIAWPVGVHRRWLPRRRRASCA
jgi:hypothetical protein